MSKEEFTTFETGGMKHSQGKLRVDLVPPEAVKSIAEGLMYGMKKYSERNWEKGLPEDVVLGSIYRHLLQIMEGEEIDQESGLPHHVHLITNAAFLTTFAKRRKHKLTPAEVLAILSNEKQSYYSSPLC